MGAQRPDFTTYECDRCGATADVPSGEPSPPKGWINMPNNFPDDWFCSWQCVKDYAEKKLRVEEAEAS